MKKAFSYLFTLTIILFMTGCGHKTITPKFVDFKEKNIVIKALDGSWEINSGETFVPTNEMISNTILPTSLFSKTTTSYDHNRVRGKVIDVIIEIEGEEPLKGKILFSNVFANSSNPSAKRKWTISIPSRFIDIAHQGSVALVYQPYRYEGKEWASWVLWMSSLDL